MTVQFLFIAFEYRHAGAPKRKQDSIIVETIFFQTYAVFNPHDDNPQEDVERLIQSVKKYMKHPFWNLLLSDISFLKDEADLKCLVFWCMDAQLSATSNRLCVYKKE